MFFETRIKIVGKDGSGQNLDLSLLVYDTKDRQWRDLTTLLGRTDAELRRSRRAGMHIFKADLKTLDKIFNFESLPYIRVTKAQDNIDKELPHFIDVVANIRQDDETITLDFGTALFLGTEHGFKTGSEDQPYFCQGVSAPLDQDRLSALAAIYFNPGTVTGFEQALENCQKRRKAAETKVKDKFALIAQMQLKSDEMSEALSSAKAEISAQATSIKSLEDMQSKLQSDLKNCKSASKKKDKLLRDLKSTHQLLQAEHDEAQRDIAALQSQLADVEMRKEELSDALKKCQEKSAALQNSIDQLEEEHAQCKAAIATAEAALDKANDLNAEQAKQLVSNAKDIEALNAKVETAQTDIALLREDKARLTEALRDCGKEKTSLTTALSLAKEAEQTVKGALNSTLNELAQCQEQRGKLEQALTEEETHSETLSDQVKDLEAVTTALTETINLQDQTEEQWQEKTKDLRVALATQTAKAQVKETQLGQVRDQIKKAVKTEDVIASIGLDASRAAESLRNKGLPYKLGRLHLNMKTIMMPDGKSLYLPDAAVSASDTALTEIDIELLPDEDALNGPSDELSCPKLLGLTQTAVITNLMNLGLKHQSSIAAVSKENEHGRAIRQIPEAGAPIVPGTVIRVIYGQHSNKGIL